MNKKKETKKNTNQNIINKNNSRTEKHPNNLPTKRKPRVSFDLTDKHRLIIDEFYINGYCKSKAVMTIDPNVANASAAVHVFNAIAGKKAGKEYIEQIQTRLRTQNHIQREQVTNELVNWSFVDATDFIGLTVEQVQALPSSVRRSIQSYKETERIEVDRSGNENKIKTIDLKLVNKLDAMKELAKIIGAYEIDNNQKKGITDLTDTSKEAQDALFKAMMLIKRDKNNNKK